MKVGQAWNESLDLRERSSCAVAEDLLGKAKLPASAPMTQ
jgi:hypothetical protein